MKSVCLFQTKKYRSPIPRSNKIRNKLSLILTDRIGVTVSWRNGLKSPWFGFRRFARENIWASWISGGWNGAASGNSWNYQPHRRSGEKTLKATSQKGGRRSHCQLRADPLIGIASKPGRSFKMSPSKIFLLALNASIVEAARAETAAGGFDIAALKSLN